MGLFAVVHMTQNKIWACISLNDSWNSCGCVQNVSSLNKLKHKNCYKSKLKRVARLLQVWELRTLAKLMFLQILCVEPALFRGHAPSLTTNCLRWKMAKTSSLLG